MLDTVRPLTVTPYYRATWAKYAENKLINVYIVSRASITRDL